MHCVVITVFIAPVSLLYFKTYSAIINSVFIHDVIILYLSADPSIHWLSDQTTVQSTQLTRPNCSKSCYSSQNEYI